MFTQINIISAKGIRGWISQFYGLVTLENVRMY
jgi:hypothetical protein